VKRNGIEDRDEGRGRDPGVVRGRKVKVMLKVFG
jgi:hypothetical protein